MINYNILSKKITEHYTVEFTDLIEDGEPVVITIPIFDQIGNTEYLTDAIQKRYEQEKKRLEENG